MFKEFLDLGQPEESLLNEALSAYVQNGYNWERILSCLHCDFPLMDNIYMRKAELALFNWFKPQDDSGWDLTTKEPKIQLNWMKFLDPEDKNEPENSWSSHQFIRKAGSTVTGAVHFTNLLYLKNEVRETFSVYISENENEVKTHIQDIELKLEADLLCDTVFFTLNLDSIHPEKKGSIEYVVTIERNGKVEMSDLIEYLDISRRKFSVTKWIFSSGEDEDPEESFDLSKTDTIWTEIWIESNCRDVEGKKPFCITADMSIEYSDPHRDVFSTRINFYSTGGNIYKAKKKLVSLIFDSKEEAYDIHTPVYSWSIGSFEAALSVWDEDIKKKTISFHDTEAGDKSQIDRRAEIRNLIDDLLLEEKNADPYADLYLDRFAFYPVMNEDKTAGGDLVCQDESLYLTAVKQENIRTLGVNARFLINHTEVKEKDFKCLVYDQTGRLLDTADVTLILDDNECFLVSALGSFTSFRWQKGRYRIEINYRDRCVATASFEVGDRNICGEYDADRIRATLKKAAEQKPSRNAYRELMDMSGLESVKEKVNMVRNSSTFARQRKDAGLPAQGMSLHSIFIGNPGTGKTTVAKLIGQIYNELGLLSSGHVVEEERKTLVGKYYDSASNAISDAISRAQGGILFIDNASNLYVEDDDRDPGRRIIEYLLKELENEGNRDWMLILAGSDPEMTTMLNYEKGLISRLPNVFRFQDYDEDQLIHIADMYCNERKFILSDDARTQLREVIRRDLSVKDNTFGNGRYVKDLMDRIVNINMAGRVGRMFNADHVQLQTIEACDVPSIRKTGRSANMDDLKGLIGLEPVKKSIESHINYVRMLNMRMKFGLDSSLPPLHMIFTGNPGTGKTTVADLLGEIYASMGVLSHGEVIYVERKNIVGKHIGETEDNVEKLLKRARGNILFIDEAYQLYSSRDSNDYGKIAMESLLTTLAKESTDLIVILAGYAKEMDKLISMNTGIESRFPYRFDFADYSLDELIEIASRIATMQNYTFSPEAIERIRFLTRLEIQKKKDSFGNARFIKRLITNTILPAMADRLASKDNPTAEELTLITAEDVPMTAEQMEMLAGDGFNEKAISEALQELDALVGLDKVKSAIHNFVDTARYLNNKGEKFTGKGILKWSFSGNTGTGKSTVAKILAKILKGMNLLASSEITEVRGEEIFNVPEYQCNEVLTNAMRKSRYGLLLIDGDSPECRNADFYMSSGQLRAKLTSLTAETGGAGAIVIAESTSPRPSIATSLAVNGIYDYDHTFIFDDYTADELYRILCIRMERYGISFSDEAEETMKKYIMDLCDNPETDFANARTMKHLARTINQIVVLRLSETGSDNRTVLAEDVESFVWKKIYSKIGF